MLAYLDISQETSAGPPQDLPGTPPRPSRDSPKTPNGPQESPKTPQDAPRWAQDGTKTVKEAMLNQVGFMKASERESIEKSVET